MKCLYIDLASHKGLLALVTETSVIASDHIGHRLGDWELMPRVEKLLRVARPIWPSAGRAGHEFSDLTQIACVIGPGGFMSLRVAVALANTLADHLRIPLAGIHLSDLYDARISPSTRLRTGNEKLAMSNYVWLHSTKKQELFVRGFGSFAKQWPEATLVKLEDLMKAVKEPVIWVGELISDHQSALATSVAEIRESPLRRSEEVLPEFLSACAFKKQILEPWYGRGW